jgi:L,D-peptidoglycan transpeptidase YkuD (ErfK/YbiS/YcfS/YnhG family)
MRVTAARIRDARGAIAVAVLVAALVLVLVPVPGSASTALRPVVLDGVSVDLRVGTAQVITVRHTHGTYAQVTFWALRYGRWQIVERTAAGRTGYGGLVEGTERRQGSGTTPLGTYSLPYTFGSQAKHRYWTMPYKRFDGNDYWVEDNASAYYNRYRSRERGGFRWYLDSPVNGSERLADYPGQYLMSVVIAYNYYRPVHYRGAGIFLHVNGAGATAGCVSAPAWFLMAVMNGLNPRLNPLIAIGR